MKNFNSIAMIVSLILIIFLGVKSLNRKDIQSNNLTKENIAQVKTIKDMKEISKVLKPQSVEGGNVTVTVTPNQSNWSFNITLSTHSVDLKEDLTQVSILIDEKGNEYKPTEWQGDPSGGHHRKGVLIFDKINSQPESITLYINQIGGIDKREFTWDLI